METRREILRQSLIAPLVVPRWLDIQILSGSDCLSQESAAGFRLLLRSVRPASRITIVCGSNYPANPIGVNRGAWIVHELPPRARFSDATQGLFVRYSWPHAALVRTFLRFVPVRCGDDEVIATYAGKPVAMRRRRGRTGIIVLGSMLGPALYAGDREAHRLGAEMLERIAEFRS